MVTVGSFDMVYIFPLEVLYEKSGIFTSCLCNLGIVLESMGSTALGSDDLRMGDPITYRLNKESKQKGANMLINIVFVPWAMIDDNKED